MPTTATGLTLNLRRSNYREAGIAVYGTKSAALAALAALRTAGHNCDPEIEAHQARVPLAYIWVLGRPDHYNGVTYLMTQDGSWVPGRLTDAGPCFCAGRCDCSVPWSPLPRVAEPATFTHVTRTVPDSANRRESYRTKSNGSCGRWVTSDDSVALCTCTWRQYGANRTEAQAAARRHRAEFAGRR